MTLVSHGKPCVGNPHAWFEEGASAKEKPRRSALLHTTEKSYKRLTVMLGFAAFSFALLADGYQFIISGDPVAAATSAANHFGCSSGVALSARPFAYGESDGGSLDSTEFQGFIMVIR